jgi:hypothetical protein
MKPTIRVASRAAVAAAITRRCGGEAEDPRMLTKFAFVARPVEILAVVGHAIDRASKAQEEPRVNINWLLDELIASCGGLKRSTTGTTRSVHPR